MNEPTTHALDVSGAVLTYDIRSSSELDDEPALLLFASPMVGSGKVRPMGRPIAKKATTLEDLREESLAHCEARNLSGRTIEW
jgi:hypothetical protein